MIYKLAPHSVSRSLFHSLSLSLPLSISHSFFPLSPSLLSISPIYLFPLSQMINSAGNRDSSGNGRLSVEMEGDTDAMYGRDDYPCSSSNSFYDKMRQSPNYSKLVQQEDAVATSKVFKGLNNLLDATESGEGDAMAWHVQYVAGKPLFTHIR